MGRPKILVADDSAVLRMMMKMILQKGGKYDVVEAVDGREAVSKASEEKPDLILLDVIMPNMTGFEACEELRRRDGTKETPIIMVTGRGEDESIKAGFDSGCNDYVTKPVKSYELVEKIERLLG